MYYDPANPATFGPNTSIAYGGLPAQTTAQPAPAAPAPTAPVVPAAAPTRPGAKPVAASPGNRKHGRWGARSGSDAMEASYGPRFTKYMDRVMNGLSPTSARMGGPTGASNPGFTAQQKFGLSPHMAHQFFGGTPWAQGLEPVPQRPVTFGNGEINAWRQQYQDWIGQAAQKFQAYQQANPQWQQAVYDWWAANNQPHGGNAAQRGLLARDMGV